MLPCATGCWGWGVAVGGDSVSLAPPRTWSLSVWVGGCGVGAGWGGRGLWIKIVAFWMVKSGRLSSQDTSTIRTLLYSPLFRMPLQSGHLSVQDASLIKTPLCSGRLSHQDTSVFTSIQDASPIRTPLCSGHLFNQDTSLSLCSGRL